MDVLELLQKIIEENAWRISRQIRLQMVDEIIDCVLEIVEFDGSRDSIKEKVKDKLQCQ